MGVSHRTCVPRVLIYAYVVIAFIHLTVGEKANVELSIDEGRTWQRHDEPPEWLPAMSLLRPEGSSSVFVRVPRCALMSSLQVQIWHLDDSNEEFGLSWESAGCDGIDETSYSMDGIHVKPTFRRTKSLEPLWWKYVHKRPSVEATVVDEKNRKSKGFFAKYGLYIMVAVGFAMAHGIRIGLSELHAEVQREEARIAAGTVSARGRSDSESVHVVVPQTRKGVRQRKKATKGNAASSKHAL